MSLRTSKNKRLAMKKAEIWKDIEGHERVYQVSNFGRVRSLRYGKKKVLKTHPCSPGYLQLNLYKNKINKKALVHRLVAKAFCENPGNKEEVNHKDGNKLNNYYMNLEWATHAENFDHAYGNLFDNKGENHGNSKLTNSQVAIIKKRLNKGESYKEIAQDYNVCKSTINYIGIRRTWRHVVAKK